MDVNGLAMIGIFLTLCIWFVYEVISALNRGWWKCPVCDFRTSSEEEALGHQARQLNTNQLGSHRLRRKLHREGTWVTFSLHLYWYSS